MKLRQLVHNYATAMEKRDSVLSRYEGDTNQNHTRVHEQEEPMRHRFCLACGQLTIAVHVVYENFTGTCVVLCRAFDAALASDSLHECEATRMWERDIQVGSLLRACPCERHSKYMC